MVELEDKVVKFYQDPAIRDHSFKWQRRCFDHGLAPETGERIFFPEEVIFSPHLHEDSDIWDGTYGYVSEKANTELPISEKADIIDYLAKKFTELNIDYGDLTYNNIGVVGDRPVCIDFDLFGMGCL